MRNKKVLMLLAITVVLSGSLTACSFGGGDNDEDTSVVQVTPTPEPTKAPKATATPEKYPNVSGAFSSDSGTPFYVLSYNEAKSENCFGYYIFGDIAYRHVARSGFFFRAGISPALNFGGKHGVYRGFGNSFENFSVIPTLSFGWAF